MSDSNMQMTMETDSVLDSGYVNNGDSYGDTATRTLQSVNIQNGHTGATGATERHRKRRRQNTGSVELANFEALNRDEQNSAIFAKLIICEQTQNRLERLEPVVHNNTERVYTAEINIEANTRRLKMLAYKQLDIEMKLRKNNLIFRGLNENNDVYSTVDSLFERLSINSEEVGVAEAYRLGGYRNAQDRAARAGNDVRRPILVSFRYPSDAEGVLSRAYMLKGTRFSIDRDYPQEIASARRRIWPDFKRIRSQNPNSKVLLKYPARVEVDGNTVLEMFPEWVEIMKERSSSTYELAVPKPSPVEYTCSRPTGNQPYNPPYKVSQGRPNESLSQVYIVDTESDSDNSLIQQQTMLTNDRNNISQLQDGKQKVHSGNKQTSIVTDTQQNEQTLIKTTINNYNSNNNKTDSQHQQQGDRDRQLKNVNNNTCGNNTSSVKTQSTANGSSSYQSSVNRDSANTRGDNTSSIKQPPIANESPGAQSGVNVGSA